MSHFGRHFGSHFGGHFGAVGVDRSHVYEQGYRVADASLERYELYVGVDAPVDFDASGQPVATSTTLPFSWTPPLPGIGLFHDLHLVCRRRDKWGLQSFNVFERVLRINHVGSAVTLPPSAPRDVAVYDKGTKTLRVIATYLSVDDPSPADAWEIYVKIGSDPVPGVDVPVYSGVMHSVGYQAGLAVTVSDSSWVPGSTAHVIVVAKRTADGARGAAAAVLHVMAASLDLDDGSGFGGESYEQE